MDLLAAIKVENLTEDSLLCEIKQEMNEEVKDGCC